MEGYRNRNVAVVGASGFMGLHLAAALSQAGARVLGVSRSGVVPSAAAGVPPVQPLKLGIEDAGALRDAFTAFRPSVVFHLAARPDGPENPVHMRACLKQNTECVLNVLDAAGAAGAETFIFGDSSKVYGNTESAYTEALPANPVCSYAIAKAAAWQLCVTWSAMAGSPRVSALRPTLVYGPGQGKNLISYLMSQVSTGLPIRVQGGGQTRDPLYIDDAIDAFLRLGLCDGAAGHAIPVGGGCEMKVSEICRKVLAACNSDAELRFDSDDVRLTELFRSRCDNSDALRLLGWRPQVGLDEGVARVASHLPDILNRRLAIA